MNFVYIIIFIVSLGVINIIIGNNNKISRKPKAAVKYLQYKNLNKKYKHNSWCDHKYTKIVLVIYLSN